MDKTQANEGNIFNLTTKHCNLKINIQMDKEPFKKTI